MKITVVIVLLLLILANLFYKNKPEAVFKLGNRKLKIFYPSPEKCWDIRVAEKEADFLGFRYLNKKEKEELGELLKRGKITLFSNTIIITGMENDDIRNGLSFSSCGLEEKIINIYDFFEEKEVAFLIPSAK